MSYNTIQRKAIIDFLTKYKDEQFTIEEIAKKLNCDDNAPGKSSIYRIMLKLVEEGSVKRFVKGQTRQFAYQATNCVNHNTHLHLKCTKCGKLFHMDVKTSDDVVNDVLKNNGFSVDEEQTVLFGKCSKCK